MRVGGAPVVCAPLRRVGMIPRHARDPLVLDYYGYRCHLCSPAIRPTTCWRRRERTDRGHQGRRRKGWRRRGTRWRSRRDNPTTTGTVEASPDQDNPAATIPSRGLESCCGRFCRFTPHNRQKVWHSDCSISCPAAHHELLQCLVACEYTALTVCAVLSMLTLQRRLSVRFSCEQSQGYWVQHEALLTELLYLVYYRALLPYSQKLCCERTKTHSHIPLFHAFDKRNTYTLKYIMALTLACSKDQASLRLRPSAKEGTVRHVGDKQENKTMLGSPSAQPRNN